MKRKDGGPAFASDTSTGMSLRDYFAAHAPNDVPDWYEDIFKVINPPAPPTLLRVKDAPEELREELELEQVGAGEGRLSPAAQDFADRITASRKAEQRYWLDRRAEAATSWRYFYADLMLEQRKK